MTFSAQGSGGTAIPTKKRPNNWKRNLLGVAISVVCLAFIAWRIDLHEVRDAIAHFDWIYLSIGLLSLTAGYTARVIRWWALLRAGGSQISAKACVAPFLGSIALNNVLPMRLGDVVRALVFPAAIGVGKVMATGSLVMERLVDLMTLLACLAIGLAASPSVQLPDWLATTAIGLAIGGGVMLALVFLCSRALAHCCERFMALPANGVRADRNRLFEALRDLLNSFDAMSRIPVLMALFVLSILVWAGETGLFWALLVGFGLDAQLDMAVVVMAIATLATLVPSSPGYVGPFHLAAYTAVAMLGGTDTQAASFAVISHLGVWLPTTLAGALAILLNPQLFGRLRAGAAQS
jgi:glycosyltransferase 2 family protein